MRQQSKFWIALVLITLVCYLDYQFFIEGYSVRNLSSTTRQIGHLSILLAVIPIGYWAWAKHEMAFLKKLWLWAYSGAVAFILIVGLLKTQTNILSHNFMEWSATVRYVFCSPLPHLLLFMLSKIADSQNKQ